MKQQRKQRKSIKIMKTASGNKKEIIKRVKQRAQKKKNIKNSSIRFKHSKIFEKKYTYLKGNFWIEKRTFVKLQNDEKKQM